MSEYILVTLKNKSNSTNKKFYWTSGNNKKSLSYYLNSRKTYFLKKYLNMTKRLKKIIKI